MLSVSPMSNTTSLPTMITMSTHQSAESIPVAVIVSEVSNTLYHLLWREGASLRSTGHKDGAAEFKGSSNSHSPLQFLARWGFLCNVWNEHDCCGLRMKRPCHPSGHKRGKAIPGLLWPTALFLYTHKHKGWSGSSNMNGGACMYMWDL